jgi:hypothetical protein
MAGFVDQMTRLIDENEPRLERVPIGWNHPIDKNSLQIDMMEHVSSEKVE